MRTDLYIDGQWCAGASRRANINPSDTGDCIGEFAQGEPEHITTAIAAARRAQVGWAESPLEQRYAILSTIGQNLIARAPELGELLSREEGKPRAEGCGEVSRAGQFFTYYAAEVLRQMGEICQSVRAGVEVQVTREPRGVIGVITPWNFPTALPSWKIAPAIAYGNAVVWKPAELTPASASALMEIIAATELPPGVVNMVHGSGATIGAALCQSPDLNAITFTGSLATGRQVAAAAATHLTPVQLEMGSKNPLVVLDDANLDGAIACAVNGAFGSSGQKCTAASRLIVTPGIHDRFVAAMQSAMAKLVVGPALAPDTTIGPLASQEQLDRSLHYIAVGEQDGAVRVVGGELVAATTPGYYLSPALFTDGDNTATLNRTEVFGPVTCVIRADDYDHALTLANDSPFGLTASIITQSLHDANHFKRYSQSGCVMVNLPTSGTDYHVPFGGRKNSSLGPREQGRYAAEFYTQVKTTYLKT